MTTSDDAVNRLYRIVIGFGLVGVLLLAAGVAEFFYFEPVGQHTGARARVTGVFEYDPARRIALGQPRERFSETTPFAAEVDWSALPAGLVVDARWLDSFGDQVAATAPAAAALQPRVVPAPVADGGNLPGEYVFVVERWDSGRPVELLARTSAVVRRSG